MSRSSTEGWWRAGRPWAGAVMLVLLVFAFEVFHRLDASNVCIGNEAVEGLVVQRLVERGEPVVASARDDTVYKPPLFHWTAATMHRLGNLATVTATSLRATSALYAVATLLLVLFLTRRLFGARAAFLSVLSLAAAYQYVSEGRFGRVDMALTFYEWAALAAFVLWLRTRGAGALWLAALAMGLATLTKGPVGALLPGGTMVLFLVLERRLADLRALVRPGPLLLIVAIGTSFYLSCWLAGRDDVLQRQVANENFGRFFGTLGRMKAWYYLDPLLLNSVPMSLLAPFAVVAALRTRRGGRDDRSPGDQIGVPRLLALFWVVTVVFFSVAAYKRPNYILPLWPAVAVLLGWWSDRWIDRWQWRGLSVPWRTVYAAACVVMIAFDIAYVPVKEQRECVHEFGRTVAEAIVERVPPDARLSTFGLDDEKDAPVLFYLHRRVLPLRDGLDAAPAGYTVVLRDVWLAERSSAAGFEEVLSAGPDARRFTLLRRAESNAAAAGTRTDG